MILQVENASFGYGENFILKDINFVLPKNEILTILGPNGAGKTTLLKCIIGFQKWAKGSTYLKEKALSEYSTKELWSMVSYVPQAKQNAFSYSGIDTVVMGCNANLGFFDKPKAKDYEKAAQIMEEIGIQYLADKFCDQMSGGELQMVLMARALVSSPELLILDEPESNLDMRNQLRVIEVIEGIREKYKTSCIINTHFPNHALKISDHTIMLGHDNLQTQGKSSDIITEENIEKFFKVKSKIVPVDLADESFKSIFPYARVI